MSAVHDRWMENAKVAQLVEHDLAKVGVAGSNPVFRSKDVKGCNMQPSMFKKRAENPFKIQFARVVELVDTQDLKSCDHCGRAGSIPAPGTKPLQEIGEAFYFCKIGE